MFSFIDLIFVAAVVVAIAAVCVIDATTINFTEIRSNGTHIQVNVLFFLLKRGQRSVSCLSRVSYPHPRVTEKGANIAEYSNIRCNY